MQKDKFYKILHRYSAFVDESVLSELRSLYENFPYFQVNNILLLYLMKKMELPEFEVFFKKMVISIPDRKNLLLVFNELKSTDYEQVDAFQMNIELGIDKTGLQEKLTLEEWIQKFSHETSAGKNEKEDLITKFLKKTNKFSTKRSKPQPVSLDDYDEKDTRYEDISLFTETLAKIYEKQGYYEKAIKVYKELMLVYPKKNTYFASRIKELEEKQKK